MDEIHWAWLLLATALGAVIGVFVAAMCAVAGRK